MRILVMTAPFPWPSRGACEQDRAEGIKQLIRMGHDVLVLTLLHDWQSADDVDSVSRQLGIPMRYARYPESWDATNLRMLVRRAAACARNPGLLDGSSYEYSYPDIIEFFEQHLTNWRPDLVWFDHTSAWFLLQVTQRFGIPVVFRSHNFEPFHFLDYHGWSLGNLVKFVGKLIAEYTCARKADAMVAISPDEKAMYRRLVRQPIHLLPLRSLPTYLRSPRKQRDRVPLEVFFLGSTFNVKHNREGVQLLVEDIVPALRRQTPGQFRIHVLGGKRPSYFNQYIAEDLIFHGFVEDLEDFLDNMDIALMPTFSGRGMKQKVFEPLCRGFPSVVARKATSGYPFRHGVHILLANNRDEFVEQLISLQSADKRESLSRQATRLSMNLFNQEKIDAIVESILTAARG